ncbi:hypothetical protein F2P44_33215 [Massilia sp. CCM 8695]|uniref:Uncharacterized protein n=1 Tax=Massilia frigida TaxID=2609281 RepID=A0ABX0NKE5_9BURK|nr:hypothetical protein [Massilia frigida]NHZ84083.1 hypothetical protein [Massilia frigida]
MNFDDIPLESLFRANWLADLPDLIVLKVEVIAYLHALWRPSKSSPRNSWSCLALASYTSDAIAGWMLAPIYKVGRRDVWSLPEIECGDRLIPLDPGYRRFSSYPGTEQIDELVTALEFFNLALDEETIESWYVVRDGAMMPPAPGA